jgi:putative transposase
MNPVRAGIVSQPKDYRWSSCRLYYEDNAPESYVNTDFVLRLLSENKIERKEKYRLLLKQGSDLRIAHIMEQEDAIEHFQSKLMSIFPSIFNIICKNRQIAGLLGVDVPSIGELEKQIEIVGQNHDRGGPESKRAKKYLIEQLISRGYKRSEIAERLGVSRKTVYNILNASL